MGTDHPSMKLALVFLQKCPVRDFSVQLKSGFCSSLKELIKYLHDLMGTDGVSILAMQDKVVSCAMIQQGLLAGSIIRDPQGLEGSCQPLLTLFFHPALTASGVGYFSSWGTKGDNLGDNWVEEGPSPSMPQDSARFVHHWPALSLSHA